MADEPLVKVTFAGDWSEPVKTLIEKCSDAIGAVYEPRQIRRTAKARADAAITQTKTDIKIAAMQRRAMTRFLAEETKKQANMEGILLKALPDVKPDAQTKDVENDWLANFFDKCRLISDEEMQSLWARILAGEANLPGKFSKRTVNLVGSLDKTDATIFTQLCSFVADIAGLTPLVMELKNPIYASRGIGFGSLSHLEAAGLIQLSGASGFLRTELQRQSVLQYFDRQFSLTFPEGRSEYQLSVGYAFFTVAGFELWPLCKAEPHPDFIGYLAEKWKRYSIEVKGPGLA
jgi:hypothetical protein